jgi:hypothetical protein
MQPSAFRPQTLDFGLWTFSFVPEPICNTLRGGGAAPRLFPSYSGNRPNTGPPTEEHEDLFTGKAAHVDAETQSQLPLTMPTDCELQFTLPDVLKVPPISSHGNVNEIMGRFGGAANLRNAVNQLQSLLYAA